jgi:hypothetical protein
VKYFSNQGGDFYSVPTTLSAIPKDAVYACFAARQYSFRLEVEQGWPLAPALLRRIEVRVSRANRRRKDKETFDQSGVRQVSPQAQGKTARWTW